MKPVSTSSSVTSTSSPASPTSEAFNRGGFDSDGNQPPPLFYDTSDESDYDPTGLLTPVSINLEYEREWQREQNRYQQEREIRKAQYQRAKEAEAALAAKKARAGIYMRTRAGIFKNEKDLSGWDGCFCYLDRRGKIEITESVWAYVMRHVDPMASYGPSFEPQDAETALIEESIKRPGCQPRKMPKTSSGRIQKSWRARKPHRKQRVDVL